MLKVNFGENIGTDLTAGNHGGPGKKTFHGSGLAVVPGRYCETCLKKGHQCPAREGSNECIFCEDNAPCPVMQRAVTRVPTVRGPMPIGEKPPRLHRSAERQAAAAKRKSAPVSITVHAEKPKEFIESPAAKELIRAAMKEIAVKETARTCSEPECGKALRSNNTSGRCSKHFYVPKNGKRRAGGAKVKTKTQRKTAKPAAASNGNGIRSAANLLLTEPQIDALFAGMTLDNKVRCLQAHFDEEL